MPTELENSLNGLIEVFHKYSQMKGNNHAVDMTDFKKLIDTECPRYTRVRRNECGWVSLPAYEGVLRHLWSTILFRLVRLSLNDFPFFFTEQGLQYLVQRIGYQQWWGSELRGVPHTADKDWCDCPQTIPQWITELLCFGAWPSNMSLYNKKIIDTIILSWSPFSCKMRFLGEGEEIRRKKGTSLFFTPISWEPAMLPIYLFSSQNLTIPKSIWLYSPQNCSMILGFKDSKMSGLPMLIVFLLVLKWVIRGMVVREKICSKLNVSIQLNVLDMTWGIRDYRKDIMRGGIMRT